MNSFFARFAVLIGSMMIISSYVVEAEPAPAPSVSNDNKEPHTHCYPYWSRLQRNEEHDDLPDIEVEAKMVSYKEGSRCFDDIRYSIRWCSYMIVVETIVKADFWMIHQYLENQHQVPSLLTSPNGVSRMREDITWQPRGKMSGLKPLHRLTLSRFRFSTYVEMYCEGDGAPAWWSIGIDVPLDKDFPHPEQNRRSHQLPLTCFTDLRRSIRFQFLLHRSVHLERWDWRGPFSNCTRMAWTVSDDSLFWVPNRLALDFSFYSISVSWFI